MALRNFSSVAVATTLTAGITSGATSITVASVSGYPSAPFIARIDADTVNEELVLVTAVAGTTLTVTRGYDSTVAVSHSSGATFSHAAAAIDFREANLHIEASTGVHGVTGSVVGTTDTQTLTNKTLTAPIFSTISNGGTLTLPTSTDTLVGRATTDTLTNKTLTSPAVNDPTLVLSSSSSTTARRLAADTANGRLLLGDGSAALQITADNKAATLTNKTLTSPTINTPSISGSGGALTLPAGPDTLVGRATTDTLTNKTLTSPVISTIVNTGTLTLPTSTDTLVGRATTDTLTNKTISAGTLSGTTTVSGTFAASGQFGGWTSYSPTFSVSGGGATLGTGGTATGAFLQLGSIVFVRILITFGTSPSAGTGQIQVTLPVAPAATQDLVCHATDDSTTTRYQGTAVCTAGAGVFRILVQPTPGAGMTMTSPFTVAVNDSIVITGCYEV